MQLLELFCGTKSISKVFQERGHKVFTIDIDGNFNPDLEKDIMALGINEIPFKPDVIWASPPCNKFSVASLYRYWDNGNPKKDETIQAILLICKTIALIKALNPKIWFIENPRGMLRKQWFMKGLPRKTITYCQYGDFRQKPTDIWTNCLLWTPKKPCSPGDKCHETAKRGQDKGTQNLANSETRAIIPRGLCLEICDICERFIT